METNIDSVDMAFNIDMWSSKMSWYISTKIPTGTRAYHDPATVSRGVGVLVSPIVLDAYDHYDENDGFDEEWVAPPNEIQFPPEIVEQFLTQTP